MLQAAHEATPCASVLLYDTGKIAYLQSLHVYLFIYAFQNANGGVLNI